MTEPVWLSLEVVLAVHDEQLAEHGGLAGIRDRGLLKSALSRPKQLSSHGQPDLAELAAAYAFGLTRNHPFVDGNKRVSAVAAELFLNLNGLDLTANDSEVVAVWLQRASGSLDEAALTSWLRANVSEQR